MKSLKQYFAERKARQKKRAEIESSLDAFFGLRHQDRNLAKNPEVQDQLRANMNNKFLEEKGVSIYSILSLTNALNCLCTDGHYKNSVIWKQAK